MAAQLARDIDEFRCHVTGSGVVRTGGTLPSKANQSGSQPEFWLRSRTTFFPRWRADLVRTFQTGAGLRLGLDQPVRVSSGLDEVAGESEPVNDGGAYLTVRVSAI